MSPRRKRRVSPLWLATVAVTAMLFSTLAAGATLSAGVDRKHLYQDEHVLFTLSLINSETRLRAIGEAPNVDLTLLSQDFELGTPQATHNYNIFRNRGRATSAITVPLFPKHSGKLRIPAFTIGGLRSEPITLDVLPARADKTPAVFSRSGVTRAKVWTREPALAYLDLYHRVELKEARLGGKIETTPLQVQLSKLPQTERKVTIDGMTYAVTRSLWSITPLDERPITVDFPDIWVETASGDKLRLPFTSSKIEVTPLPEDVPPGILMGKPSLSQRLEGGLFRAGEPIPWEITLTAPVDINQLPDTLPVSGVSPRIKLYQEKAIRTEENPGDTGNPQSTAVYHGFIIPLASGEITTPAIRLPYFDTASGFATILELKGEVLTVREAVTTARQPPPMPAEATPPTLPPPHEAASWPWRTISAVLASLWLATLGLWWWRGRTAREDGKTAGTRDISSNSNAPPLIALLLEALQSTTLERGLRGWERRHGRDDGLRGVIAALQRHYYGGRKAQDEEGLRQEVVETASRIRRASREADRGPDADPWSPRNFQRSLK